ncbi:MAG: ABC transporter permease, partial [Pyrinomonadaceae bacterium]|nr:ABC transporter permease [Pyrinomonadaceae bacterium]
MQSLWHDVRYGARMLARKPGFTLIAVLTLALGIGANTAIFSVINSVILRPLPYPQAERIVQAYWQWGKSETPAVTATQYVFWKENSRSFAETSAYAPTSSGFNLAGGAEPQRVRGIRASESFFRVLGVSPALGRAFTPEEDQPSAPCAAVISNDLWRNYFGGDPGTIRRQIELNGQSCSIVGVLPAGFHFETPVDVFTPLRLQANPKDQGHNTNMLARLKDGVTPAQAQAEMDALLSQFRNAYPGHIGNSERGIRLLSYQESIVGNVGKLLWVLFGAVGFVLLIACANVANLLLAQSTNRRGELAVRVALGASRWRIIRQMMTENVLLALVGAAAGLLLAVWSVPALLALSPEGLPRLEEISLDANAALFAVLAAFVTSLLFGIAPAVQATRVDVNDSLKSVAGRAGVTKLGARLRGLTIAGQVALSLVLLVGATLLIQSFIKLRSQTLGFDPQNVTTVQVSLNSARYQTTAQSWNLQQQVMEKIRALPGITAVATVPSLPMERGLNNNIVVEGRPEVAGMSVEARAVGGDYFGALGITRRRGRDFSPSDTANSQPVIILNETLARRIRGTDDPVGREVTLNGKNHQVVGIVGDVKERGFDRPVAPTVYTPASQVPDSMTVATNRWFLTSWIVKTSEPIDLGAALRRAVREVDPQLPVANIRPLSEVVSSSVAAERFTTTLMSIFAGLALLLTSIGLYGVLSYLV